MTTHKGVTIYKKAGHAVPDAMLAKALEAFPTHVGYAIAAEGQFFTQSYDAAFTVDDINTLQVKGMDNNILLYFGNYPDGSIIEDVNPLPVVKDAEGNIIVMAALDGDFSGYQHEGSKHSAVADCVAEILGPTLQEVYDDVGGDIDKFLAKLKTPHKEKFFKSLFVERGTITLMTNTDEIISFGTNPDSMQYDWGNTTNDLGFSKVAAPVKTVVEQAKAVVQRFGIGGPKPAAKVAVEPVAAAKTADTGKSTVREAYVKPATTARPAPMMPGEIKKDVVAEAVKPKPTATAVIGKPRIDGMQVWASPPEEARQSNNQTKKWYDKACGYQPPNWPEYPEVELKNKKMISAILYAAANPEASKPLKSFKELDKKIVAAVEPVTTNKDGVHVVGNTKIVDVEHPRSGADIAAARANKDTSNHNVPNKTVLPIMDGSTKHKLNELFKAGKLKKTLDFNHQEVMDPKTHQQLEAKHSTFTEQLGIKDGLEVTFPWGMNEYTLIEKETPGALAVLMMQTKHRLFRAEASLKALAATKTTTTAPEAEPAPQKVAAAGGKRFSLPGM